MFVLCAYENHNYTFWRNYPFTVYNNCSLWDHLPQNNMLGKQHKLFLKPFQCKAFRAESGVGLIWLWYFKAHLIRIQSPPSHCWSQIEGESWIVGGGGREKSLVVVFIYFILFFFFKGIIKRIVVSQCREIGVRQQRECQKLLTSFFKMEIHRLLHHMGRNTELFFTACSLNRLL